MEFKTSPTTIAIGLLTLVAVLAAIGWQQTLIVYGIQIASAFLRGFLAALRD